MRHSLLWLLIPLSLYFFSLLPATAKPGEEELQHWLYGENIILKKNILWDTKETLSAHNIKDFRLIDVKESYTKGELASISVTAGSLPRIGTGLALCSFSLRTETGATIPCIACITYIIEKGSGFLGLINHPKKPLHIILSPALVPTSS